MNSPLHGLNTSLASSRTNARSRLLKLNYLGGNALELGGKATSPHLMANAEVPSRQGAALLLRKWPDAERDGSPSARAAVGSSSNVPALRLLA